jgi:hypothetical protein
MSLIVSGKNYTPAPEGVHAAVCVDVADKGMVETEWGSKHKCRIVWEIAAPMDDGRPFTIGKTYTVSLHEKSSLYKDLKGWRGRAFTADELRGFDLENVVGKPCQLVVAHNDVDGTTYANVQAILKADVKNQLKPSGKYVRAKDRTDAPAQTTSAPATTQPEEDNIPF